MRTVHVSYQQVLLSFLPCCFPPSCFSGHQVFHNSPFVGSACPHLDLHALNFQPSQGQTSAARCTFLEAKVSLSHPQTRTSSLGSQTSLLACRNRSDLVWTAAPVCGFLHAQRSVHAKMCQVRIRWMHVNVTYKVLRNMLWKNASKGVYIHIYNWWQKRFKNVSRSCGRINVVHHGDHSTSPLITLMSRLLRVNRDINCLLKVLQSSIPAPPTKACRDSWICRWGLWLPQNLTMKPKSRRFRSQVFLLEKKNLYYCDMISLMVAWLLQFHSSRSKEHKLFDKACADKRFVFLASFTARAVLATYVNTVAAQTLQSSREVDVRQTLIEIGSCQKRIKHDQTGFNAHLCPIFLFDLVVSMDVSIEIEGPKMPAFPKIEAVWDGLESWGSKLQNDPWRKCSKKYALNGRQFFLKNKGSETSQINSNQVSSSSKSEKYVDLLAKLPNVNSWRLFGKMTLSTGWLKLSPKTSFLRFSGRWTPSKQRFFHAMTWKLAIHILLLQKKQCNSWFVDQYVFCIFLYLIFHTYA